MSKWRAALMKKRDLEAQVQAAEEALNIGRSELQTVEGPMAFEVMAQHFVLNKKSRRVQQVSHYC